MVFQMMEHQKIGGSCDHGRSMVWTVWWLQLLGMVKVLEVMLLYASKYIDVKAVVNISGRYDLKAGIEEHLRKNYLERIKEVGFMDVKRPRSPDYRVNMESLLDRLDTNTYEACL